MPVPSPRAFFGGCVGTGGIDYVRMGRAKARRRIVGNCRVALAFFLFLRRSTVISKNGDENHQK